MARRRVIADSEDEDEGDEVIFHPTGDFDRPEPEPLSPPGQHSSVAAAESHHDQLHVTDPSSFANGYDDQRNLSVQQSHLIENIVRQSQRASASSGDVSLPAQKRRRRADRSSGTDVTSPTASKRARNHATLLSDGVSEFTTPRKSTGQEWEIPSSPEDATTSINTKCAPKAEEKTYGSGKKRKSRLISSPATTEMFAAEKTAQQAASKDNGVDNRVDGDQRTGAMLTPTAKRKKVSHHDLTLPDTTKFYIAQSNLTTMQKLEYQKVNVSLNGYGGLPGSLPHQKSSGVTTIAYSTPSGYSPVPPLPWEEPLEQPASPLSNKVINISSSPDVMDSRFEFPNENNSVARLETDMTMPNPKNNRKFSVKPPAVTSVSNGKRAAQGDEEDELWKDEVGDLDPPDLPPTSYKPKVTKPRPMATGFPGIEDNPESLEGILDEAVTQTESIADFIAPALPDTDPPPLPDTDPPELPDTNCPEPPEPSLEVVAGTTESYLNQDSTSPQQATEAEPSVEKPKKRRGRPRKSGPPKAAKEQLPEPYIASELPRLNSPREDSNNDESSTVLKKQKNTEQKAKREKCQAIDEIEDTPSKDNRLALKEVDSNLKTSSKLDSTKESPTKTRAEPQDEEPTPKKGLRETPKLTASQPKVPYRVGLSKRSRIAPLLKSIKK
ncbi:hypothetical protein O1611_g8397 [Lasiodiplodia mahajangana]|uniref:Uncharacterized protein n=1 Tax=Lasiodiplodia mahajangana TaxID=1108764 RepID=A0ACC2JDD1_9PEZI|nr:hypothetical protein O1611_g8397 [Lasiodiplodia mahajangana]